MRALYQRSREAVAAQGKADRARWKAEVMEHYGNGRCAECSVDAIDLLNIDHVDGGGNAHRRETGGSGWRTYKWLIEHGFPDGFQVLCFNHNMAKSFPHVATKRRYKTKEAALDAYGRSCAHCGEGDPSMLQFSHIGVGGRAHFREIRTNDLASWLIRNGFPPGFQVLCANCNARKLD